MKVNSQLERAQLENLSSLPSAATAGRVAWNTTDGKAYIDDATNWRAFLRNDAHAIIGNSGTAANNIRLHRGANGVLQFVSGADATAEGTLSTALNQISGRLENYTAAGKPAAGNAGRIAYITDTGLVNVDTGAAWVALSLGTVTQNVSTKTANYTALTTDGIILFDATSGNLDATLLTAVGHAGLQLTIQKIDTSANVVTVKTTSSQLIGGRASADIVLSKLNTFVTVVSDGANWIIVNKYEHQVVFADGNQTVNGPSASFQNNGAVITLGIGEWEITGNASLNAGAGSINIALDYLTGFYAANGANSTTTPTAVPAGVIDGPTTINDLVGGGFFNPMPQQSNTGNYMILPLVTRVVVTSGTQAIYYVLNVSYGTAGSSSVYSHIEAKRIW